MWRNTASVPVLDSFAQAKEWFENTKPIRGNKDKMRPLGSRRHYHMASIDMPDADTVVLKYYNEPFVTWRSDDTFMVTNNVYNSAYSAQHLPFFLPKRWETKWNGCRMTIGNKGKYYLMPQGTTLHFAKAGDDYELVNKPVAYAIRKKRGADKKILAKCVPFFDWLTVVSAISNTVTHDESTHAKDVLREHAGYKSASYYVQRWQDMHKTGANFSAQEREKRYEDYRMIDIMPTSISNYTHVAYRLFNTESSLRLLEWVEDDNAENWVLAMNVIAERAGSRRYREGGIQFELNADQAAKYLTEIARHVHRDTIFYKEQLEDGVVPSRSNAVYFRSHSFSV